MLESVTSFLKEDVVTGVAEEMATKWDKSFNRSVIKAGIAIASYPYYVAESLGTTFDPKWNKGLNKIEDVEYAIDAFNNVMTDNEEFIKPDIILLNAIQKIVDKETMKKTIEGKLKQM